LRQEPVQAQDRADRAKLAVGSGGVVFTTIQKFLPDERGDTHPVLSRSAGKCPPVWATPPRSVDAPFVELHERHSTAVLAISNGAPPAASGTT
jgi:type I site-specific restriction-modification system R (restriction) subunit